MDEQIPQWAVELTRQVTILNERLPNHVTWTERNIDDHEQRLRVLEQFRWGLVGMSFVMPILVVFISKVMGF